MRAASLCLLFVFLTIAAVHIVAGTNIDDSYDDGAVGDSQQPVDSVVSKRFGFRIPWKWAVYGGDGPRSWSRFMKTNNFD
uniref:Uncharacterized protein n=1 Tax=Plectus sambesii TaxID=2011161 RepID=A0A914V4R2_9BILA